MYSRLHFFTFAIFEMIVDFFFILKDIYVCNYIEYKYIYILCEFIVGLIIDRPYNSIILCHFRQPLALQESTVLCKCL